MRIIHLLFIVVFSITVVCAQPAPDFTVTDSDGVQHQLYADHLNQGQTVVIELFFVACPPCQSAAPTVQEIYETWGEGQYDVEFIKLSTQNGDDNNDVAGFKAQYGTTFPGVGSDGGAQAARTPYMDGTYGPFFGTPSFVVIGPDGEVNSGIFLSGISDAIAATGATGMEDTSEPTYTTYELDASTFSDSQPTSIDYILSSATGNGGSYNITQITGGTNVFDYPSDIFPELEDPIVTLDITGPALDHSVRAGDLLVIMKHILQLTVLTEERKLIAADTNGDGEINAKDLLTLQKVILEIFDQFPNDTPSWKTIPNSRPLVPNIGANIGIDFELVKIGNTTN